MSQHATEREEGRNKERKKKLAKRGGRKRNIHVNKERKKMDKNNIRKR
jgi:hypothetical protein